MPEYSPDGPSVPVALPREAILRSVWVQLGSKTMNSAKVELLSFWARHPGGWSSHGVLAPWSRDSRQDLDQAIDELVELGLIKRKSTLSGPPLYALNDRHPLRKVLCVFAHLTPGEKKILIGFRQEGLG